MSHLLSSVFYDLDPRFDIIEEVCNGITSESELCIPLLKCNFKSDLGLIDSKSKIIFNSRAKPNCQNEHIENENLRSLNEMLSAVNDAKKIVNSLKNYNK